MGKNEEVTCAEARRERASFPLKMYNPGCLAGEGVPRHPLPLLLPRARQGLQFPGRGAWLQLPFRGQKGLNQQGSLQKSAVSSSASIKGELGVGGSSASPICRPRTPGVRCPGSTSGWPDNTSQPLPECLVIPTAYPRSVPISWIQKLRHVEWLGARLPGPRAHTLQAWLFSLWNRWAQTCRGQLASPLPQFTPRILPGSLRGLGPPSRPACSPIGVLPCEVDEQCPPHAVDQHKNTGT